MCMISGLIPQTPKTQRTFLKSREQDIGCETVSLRSERHINSDYEDWQDMYNEGTNRNA